MCDSETKSLRRKEIPTFVTKIKTKLPALNKLAESKQIFGKTQREMRNNIDLRQKGLNLLQMIENAIPEDSFINRAKVKDCGFIKKTGANVQTFAF